MNHPARYVKLFLEKPRKSRKMDMPPTAEQQQRQTNNNYFRDCFGRMILGEFWFVVNRACSDKEVYTKTILHSEEGNSLAL